MQTLHSCFSSHGETLLLFCCRLELFQDISAIRASTPALKDGVIANTGNEGVMRERKRVSSFGGGRTPCGVSFVKNLHIFRPVLRIDPRNGSLSKSNIKLPRTGNRSL